ncbi:BlaI/MecI/CopY family transcriptional regulator [Schlesneria paludicola]|uniref:BlaI/MecI/CopY family transcriptional regulator n=1 Tax=Schlesneria paludicola TaxID=360056 RepID=UPI000590F6E2|nr:BlaI/MecI/CopY family transcriptional regulator [Schlesneria paludicola]
MSPSPTDREMEILKVLWELGEGSVRDVHERLASKSGLHFNTIQTQLRIMDEKGLVSHRQDGRTFLYKPNCSREQVSSQFLHKVFDGALAQLVLCMLNAEQINAKELQDIEQLIADSRKRKQTRGRNKGDAK